MFFIVFLFVFFCYKVRGFVFCFDFLLGSLLMFFYCVFYLFSV